MAHSNAVAFVNDRYCNAPRLSSDHRNGTGSAPHDFAGTSRQFGSLVLGTKINCERRSCTTARSRGNQENEIRLAKVGRAKRTNERMMYEGWLIALRGPFPNLSPENSNLTSPVDEGYNCIAWAAGDTGRWWWPDAQEQNYWPPNIPRIENLECFELAYQHLGYSSRTDSTLESGSEKIAIFANEQGKPTHASRQLPNGWWTSKLGPQIDIEHELTAVEGPTYGKVAIILARASKLQCIQSQ